MDDHKTGSELLEDTSQLQQAFEKAADDMATGPLPLPSISQSGDRPPTADQRPPSNDEPVSAWFYTFMCMNIPIAGWVYLYRLAFGKNCTQRRNFARAYLFYRLVFLGIAAVILGILIFIGLDLLDKLLAYMEML